MPGPKGRNEGMRIGRGGRSGGRARSRRVPRPQRGERSPPAERALGDGPQGHPLADLPAFKQKVLLDTKTGPNTVYTTHTPQCVSLCEYAASQPPPSTDHCHHLCHTSLLCAPFEHLLSIVFYFSLAPSKTSIHTL